MVKEENLLVPLGYFGDIKGDGVLDPLSEAQVIFAVRCLVWGDVGHVLFPTGQVLSGRPVVGNSMRNELIRLAPELGHRTIALDNASINTTYKEGLETFKYVSQHPELELESVYFVANPAHFSRAEQILLRQVAPKATIRFGLDQLGVQVVSTNDNDFYLTPFQQADLAGCLAQKVFNQRELQLQQLYRHGLGRMMERGYVIPAIMKQLWEEHWIRKLLATP